MNGSRLFVCFSGTWAHPGGHLEFGESFEDCARREILEETGLSVSEIKFLTAVNTVMVEENKHYVTVFVGCFVDGEQKEPAVRHVFDFQAAGEC